MMLQSAKLKIRNKVRIKKGNTIRFLGKAHIRKCDISIRGNNNQLIIGNNVNIKGSTIEIDGENCSISINEDCVIGEGCYISCRERNINITIGHSCMFSRNVKIMTSDGHDILSGSERINPAQNIHIGNSVWLADEVIILKGVTIDDGAIVGIRSVVTKNIPQKTVSAGSPARVVKENTRWKETLTY
ncbi:MAG: acyltransferase [Lactococcus garvieae]